MFSVVVCRTAASFVVLVEMAQLDVEHGGLQCVESRVAAYDVVVVLHALAVVGYHTDALGELRVDGAECAAVAVAA